VRPHCVEQPLAIFEHHTLDAGVASAPEKERLAAGDRMGADDGMVGAKFFPRVGPSVNLRRGLPALAPLLFLAARL